MLTSQTSPLSLTIKTHEIAADFHEVSASPDSTAPLLLTQSVLLHPGEGKTVLIQIKNHGSTQLRIALDVDSSCPSQWYQLRLEGREISPSQQIDALLYLKPPIDFFESDSSAPNDTESDHELQSHSARSQAIRQLNYQIQVSVNYQSLAGAATQQVLEGAIAPTLINLYIRPSSNLLKYLPRIYQEVDFISRLVQIFEQGLDPIISSERQLWAYLDPLTAPVSLLPFLAHWVGWSFDSKAEVSQQRWLIRHAMEIYRWRGTRRGLRLLIHLHTGLPLDEHIVEEQDKHISIQEVQQQQFHLQESYLNSDISLSQRPPYHFAVTLRSTSERTLDETQIRKLIEQEKPAYCSYDLHIMPAASSHSSAGSLS